MEVQGLAPDKLPLSTAPLVVSLTGPLELRRKEQRYSPEEGSEGKAEVCVRESEHNFVRRVFICFLMLGILGEVSGENLMVY